MKIPGSRLILVALAVGALSACTITPARVVTHPVHAYPPAVVIADPYPPRHVVIAPAPPPRIIVTPRYYSPRHHHRNDHHDRRDRRHWRD